MRGGLIVSGVSASKGPVAASEEGGEVPIVIVRINRYCRTSGRTSSHVTVPKARTHRSAPFLTGRNRVSGGRKTEAEIITRSVKGQEVCCNE